MKKVFAVIAVAGAVYTCMLIWWAVMGETMTAMVL